MQLTIDQMLSIVGELYVENRLLKKLLEMQDAQKEASSTDPSEEGTGAADSGNPGGAASNSDSGPGSGSPGPGSPDGSESRSTAGGRSSGGPRRVR